MRTACYFFVVWGLAFSSASVAQAELVLPNIIAYWQFDEDFGSVAYDASPNGLDGLFWGDSSSVWTGGQFGNAANFNRSNRDYLNIGSDNVVTQLTGEKTFSFWTQLSTATTGSNGFIAILKDNDNRWYIDDDNSYGRIRMWQVGDGATSGAQLQTETGVLAYDDDVWHHVVVTDTGSGTGGASVYVDGTLCGTYDSFDYSNLPSGSDLCLGCRFVSSTESMEGGLDDFVISDTAFTATHVNAVYSLGSTAGVQYNLSRVQELLAAHNSGSDLRYGDLQWNYTTGLDTNGAELGQLVKTDGRYVIALDEAGTGFVANAELIAHWKFDESSGTTAYDSAGTNDGTLQGTGSTATHIAGKFGSALGFDSSASQSVEIGADNVITALAGAKTFAFWTRLETDSTSNGLITIDDGTSANRWYLDDQNCEGHLRAWQVGGGNDGEVFTATDVFEYDSTEWQHVLVADDGSGTNGVRVYVNGQLVHTEDSFDYSGLASGSVLLLGAARHSAVYRYLNGDLDDFGIWRVALSNAQAKALYNAGQNAELEYDLERVQRLFNLHDEGGGTRIDGRYWASADGLSTDTETLGQVVQEGQKFSVTFTESGTGVVAPGKLVAHWTFDDGEGMTVTDSMGYVDGTLTGSGGSTGTWIAEGRVGGALSLNSSQGQYVLCGSDNLVTSLPGEKTIAFWARVEEGSDTSNGFIGIDNDTSTSRWYIDTGGATDDDIRVYEALGDAAGEQLRAYDVLEFREWQHIVVTDDGTGNGGARVFVNGQLVDTDDSFEFSNLLAGSVLRLGAVRHNGGFQYLEGALDDFGIWSVELSDSQVLGLYEFATEPGLGYDLEQVQQLYDLHELGPDGGQFTLDGVWQWQYAEGLELDPGVLTMIDGDYFIRLDAAGTGLMAVPEPGVLGLLLAGVFAVLFVRRPRR